MRCSPWQNAYAERVIGSIRRECLDHVIAVNETGLSRLLNHCLTYYHQSRTHLSLDTDSPQLRPIAPPTCGQMVASAHVGGLHIGTIAERRTHKAPQLASPVINSDARMEFLVETRAPERYASVNSPLIRRICGPTHLSNALFVSPNFSPNGPYPLAIRPTSHPHAGVSAGGFSALSDSISVPVRPNARPFA